MSLQDPIDSPGAAFRSDAVVGTVGAVAGLRNTRALLALSASLFIGVLVSGLLGRLGLAGALLGGLAFIVAAALGVNAAGLLQLDASRGAAPRRLGEAFRAAALCLPTLLLLGLVLLAIALAVLVVLGLLFVCCKLPLIGPLLFLVAFPVAVVVAGLTLSGLAFGFALALPAIWQGAAALHALSQAIAIIRARVIETLLSLVVLMLLCAAVAAVIGAILGAGLVPAVGLSAAILGDRVGSYETMLAITQGYGGASHVIAALLGGGLLWALAVSLIAQVYLRGLVMLHQRASEGLDAETTEDALMHLVGGARRRASAWGERARAAAMPERNPAPTSFTAPLPASHARATRDESESVPLDAEPDAGAATDPPVASTSDARIEPTWGETPAEAGHARTEPLRVDEGALSTSAPTAATIAALPSEPARMTTSATASTPLTGTTVATTQTATPIPASMASEPAFSAPSVRSSPSREPPPSAAPAARPAAPKLSCPKCTAPISAQDVFCGVCGQRLH